MKNDNPFTWKLRATPVVWRLNPRDALIDAAKTELTADFIPAFSGINTGNSIIADFIIMTSLVADPDARVLQAINYKHPGDAYLLPDSGVIGEAYPGSDNMGKSKPSILP